MLDSDIRPALHDAFHRWHDDFVAFDELPLFRTGRADVAVVNCALWGYEIKSPRDSLKRLPLQIPFYDRVFDYSVLVTSDLHLRHARKLIPTYWGIMRVSRAPDGSVDIESVRKAKRNRSPDPESLIQLVWRREALAILKSQGIPMPHNTYADVLAEELMKLKKHVLASCVRDQLKLRGRSATDVQRIQYDDLSSTEPSSWRCLDSLHERQPH